jgi:dihydroorotase
MTPTPSRIPTSPDLPPLLLRGGRIIDPTQGTDEQRDLALWQGKVVAPDSLAGRTDVRTLDVSGLVISPGLIDLHVHLREPGRPDKETIETGSRAAAAGGFTSIVAMPNTNPVPDQASVVTWLQQRAKEKAVVNVYFTGAITQGIKGEMLAPYGALQRAGVVALSDDGNCVQSPELMRRAFEHAGMFGLPILDHCQDYALAGSGVMNEGYWSMALGLPGWPAIAEEIIIARNALLSELTGHAIHCQHVTTAGGVRILREAKERGVKISGEATPHHLTLTDATIERYDTHYKMNPPLRTARDIAALVEGLKDGTLEILASDHAPHCSFEKEVEFQEAPFGILGLETELGIYLDTLHHHHQFPLAKILRMLTTNPAQLLGLQAGTLSLGSPADVTVIDPDLEWTVDSRKFASKSRNTPYHGTRLRGRAVATIVGGDVVWSLDRANSPST